MKNNIKLIDKKINNAFNKDIFLLGKFKDGKYFWLEKASWDCDWYCGFGYIETYTNNKNPQNSKDIDSHQHYDSICLKTHESYDFDKKAFIQEDYMHTLYDNPDIDELTINGGEAWELSDLMKSFYTLKEASGLFHNGNSHCASHVGVNFKDEKFEHYINKVLMPKIFERIYQILTPLSK